MTTDTIQPEYLQAQCISVGEIHSILLHVSFFLIERGRILRTFLIVNDISTSIMPRLPPASERGLSLLQKWDPFLCFLVLFCYVVFCPLSTFGPLILCQGNDHHLLSAIPVQVIMSRKYSIICSNITISVQIPASSGVCEIAHKTS